MTNEPSRDLPPSHTWFNELASFLRGAYWRPDTGRVQAFTRGTEQEVDFLWEQLALAPGMRVLDVGCGPGRHSLELARRGIAVVGVDASEDFIDLAGDAASRTGLDARFVVLDVRELAYDRQFDAALCLCQGGFGLLGGRDEVDVFGRIVRALEPGGVLAVSAFHAPFAIRFLEAGETFDVTTGVLHERTTLHNEAGEQREFDLWTTCFTVRELELLALRAGVAVTGIYGVAPGRYRVKVPDLEDPELLLVGRRGRERAGGGAASFATM
jgi:SAM-dependent methyltransferase